MESSNLASGDDGNPKQNSPRFTQPEKCNNDNTVNNSEVNDKNIVSKNKIENITPQMIDDKENKLKDRIAQCKSIIESLKLQLNEEKEEMHKETKEKKTTYQTNCSKYAFGHYPMSDLNLADEFGTTSMFSASVDRKLNYDESLIEYEKQLQKYQNTLNMAQNEKKNAIRKQMLAKAFKLKLMEVENQCNIELLRVKQSLQCLEPLQMIANKWKSNSDENTFDVDNYELKPNFLQLKPISVSNDDCNKVNLDLVTEDVTQEDST